MLLQTRAEPDVVIDEDLRAGGKLHPKARTDEHAVAAHRAGHSVTEAAGLVSSSRGARPASHGVAALLHAPHDHASLRADPQFRDHRPYRPWQIDACRPSDPDDRRFDVARDGRAGARQHGYRA